MRRRRRNDPLADANQDLRDLRNKLHAIDQETVLPLRARIAELEHENARLTQRVTKLDDLHRLYREAWESMVRLSNAILATGKLT